MRRITAAALGSIAALIVSLDARAAEIGHFNGGFLNIRDLILPAEPGIYAAIYNFYYTTDRLNDKHGDKIDTVIANPSPGPGPGLNVPVSIDVNLDLYALSPAVIWEPDIKVLGGRYAALIAPTFANASLEAALDIGSRFGRDANNASFNIGDMLVQPLWLGWSWKHFDFNVAYGFYAATGKYDTKTRTLPLIGTVTTEDPDNIGYGFWTHQFQSAAAWYPFDHKGTAVVGAVTYEHNSEKEDFDLQPGDVVTLNWGISQYIPLTGDQHLLLEIGPAGWNGWQTSDDRGSDASNDNRDQVHAAGGQIGLTYVPWGVATNFHGFYEYKTKDRFQGTALGLSIAKKF
jgi:hypothetical protein